MLTLPGVEAIECAEEIDLTALRGAAELWVAQICDELINLEVVGIDRGGLVLAGEEGIRPELWADHRATGGNGDIGREILVFGPQSVGNPRADRRSHRLGISRLHDEQGRFVVGLIGVHRAHQAQVVGVLER